MENKKLQQLIDVAKEIDETDIKENEALFVVAYDDDHVFQNVIGKAIPLMKALMFLFECENEFLNLLNRTVEIYKQYKESPTPNLNEQNK